MRLTWKVKFYLGLFQVYWWGKSDYMRSQDCKVFLLRLNPHLHKWPVYHSHAHFWARDSALQLCYFQLCHLLPRSHAFFLMIQIIFATLRQAVQSADIPLVGPVQFPHSHYGERKSCATTSACSLLAVGSLSTAGLAQKSHQICHFCVIFNLSMFWLDFWPCCMKDL